MATAFAAGLDARLRLGADIIVNTDTDGQYPANDIPCLVEPIARGKANMAIGDRQVAAVEHFAPHKRLRFPGLCAGSAGRPDRCQSALEDTLYRVRQIELRQPPRFDDPLS